MHRLKECGRMLKLFDMCQVFDRCLILVKKSERVYNSIESRTPPHASRAHPLNYTTSQTCCPCQTFDTMAAGLLQMCNMCDIFITCLCLFLSIHFDIQQSQTFFPMFSAT